MESTKALFMKKPKGGYFVGYTQQRVRHNKNFLAAITGPTGSGKTYSALKLAELTDPNFSADQIVFTPKEFMNLLNSGNLKRGSVIVFEEAGVSMNNKNWQSIVNKMLQFVFQTFRHENYIVYFTAPHFNFIDKSTRELFHCFLQTQSIDRRRKLCKIKPLFIQLDQRSGNIYYKYLRVITPQGNAKMTKVLTGLASKDLIKEYETKKKKFTDALNKVVRKAIDEADPEEKKEAKTALPKEEQRRFNMMSNMRVQGLKWGVIGKSFSMTGEGARVWYKRKAEVVEAFKLQKFATEPDSLGSKKLSIQEIY